MIPPGGDDGVPAKGSSLYELYSSILDEFDTAIRDSNGWAWCNSQLGTRIYEASSKLRHWSRSVEWLSSQVDEIGPTIGRMMTFQMLLNHMEEKRLFMSSVIRSYLHEIRGSFSSLKQMSVASQSNDDIVGTDELQSRLDDSIECLRLQLPAIKALIHSLYNVGQCPEASSTHIVHNMKSEIQSSTGDSVQDLNSRRRHNPDLTSKKTGVSTSDHEDQEHLRPSPKQAFENSERDDVPISQGASESSNSTSDPLNGNVVPDEHPARRPLRVVSLGTNDFDQDFVQQHVAPLRAFSGSMGQLESVVQDAGYSLGPSEKADERPPQHSSDLTGLGTQFDAPTEIHPNAVERIYDLETWIRKNRVAYPKRRHIFLPIDQLERCMTAQNIRHELVRSGGCRNLEDITQKLCLRDKASRQRIFAILCMLGMSTEITEFVQEDIFDTDLPFVYKDDIMFRTAGQDGVKDGTKIDLFQGLAWSALLRETFDEYQGQIAAPIFKFSWLGEEKVKHFALRSQLILPFMYIAEPKGGDNGSIQFEGGTSVVRKTKIHPAHFNAPKNVIDKSEMYFAVKELKVRRGGREAIALKKLNSQQHPHLIRLLATYTYQDHYHLVFPWADGNLKELWETGPLPLPRQQSDPSLVLWMSEQILGLARALQLIHYCKFDKVDSQGLSPELVKNPHGRHGDLKPENILWFKDKTLEHDTSFGVLKIGDFGSTDFHSKDSRSGVRRSAVDGITYTYSAPEYDVEQQVSPQFDIWSLGCILLQFIVWYLHDWDGIESFSKQRTAESRGFMFRTDNFYSLHNDGTKAHLKRSVIQMFADIKKHEACSDYILDLVEHVETDLLRVDSNSRANIDDIVRNLESFQENFDSSFKYCTVRQKEATVHGPGCTEIVELSGYADETRSSMSRERGQTHSHSLITISGSMRNTSVSVDRVLVTREFTSHNPETKSVHSTSQTPRFTNDMHGSTRAQAGSRSISMVPVQEEVGHTVSPPILNKAQAALPLENAPAQSPSRSHQSWRKRAKKQVLKALDFALGSG